MLCRMRLRRGCAVPPLPFLARLGSPVAQPRWHSRRVRVRGHTPGVDSRAQVPPPAVCRRRVGRAHGASAAVRRHRSRHLGAHQRPPGSSTRLRPGRGDRPRRCSPARCSVPSSAVPRPWHAPDRQDPVPASRRSCISGPAASQRSGGPGGRRCRHHGCDAADRCRRPAFRRGGSCRVGGRRQHPAPICAAQNVTSCQGLGCQGRRRTRR